jgi:hypothetical protein
MKVSRARSAESTWNNALSRLHSTLHAITICLRRIIEPVSHCCCTVLCNTPGGRFVITVVYKVHC